MPGAPGDEIDIHASMARIIAGLTSYDAREIELAIREVAPPLTQTRPGAATPGDAAGWPLPAISLDAPPALDGA